MIPIGNPRLLRTAVPFDRCAYLIDLALGMSARIARIGNEISDWTVGHGQPRRRFRCRYFVHAETPPKANDRRGFAPFENTIRSAQGEAGQVGASSGGGEVRSGECRARRVQGEASAGRAVIDGKGKKGECPYLSFIRLPIMWSMCNVLT